jgi:glycosyltransferase involved in cell wall biosynthesis
MVIGIDASRANRTHKSGTEWYSYYLIRCLAKLDKDNQYILYTDQPLNGGLADLTTEQYFDNGEENNLPNFDRNGFQIIKSPYNNFKAKILKWPFNFFWTQGRMSLEMIFSRPDILFIPAHALPIIHPKKSIVTIHDIGFERDRRLYSKNEIGPIGVKKRILLNFFVRIFTLGKFGANTLDYLHWSTRYAINHAHKIITVSNFTKIELEQYYKADKDKISVIHNGYNEHIFKKINDENKIKNVLAKYGINDKYILYVGRIERKKNTPALIEAFSIAREKNKNIKQKLVLVGDASYGYDETNYMINEYAVGNEVILPGWVKEEDLPYFYNGADAYIFPSNYEGFGIPLLQAMACGVPIAASCGTSIPEVVGEAAIFFDSYDAYSIAKIIEKILTDEILRKKLVKAGLARIDNFSWEKCAKETWQLIAERQAD